MSNTDSEPKTKSDVYRDRNLLALAFITAYTEVRACPEFGWWPDTDDVNGESWAVVWVNLPMGQVGWHIRREDVPDAMPKRDPEYDGYTTAEKNDRLQRYVNAVMEVVYGE